MRTGLRELSDEDVSRQAGALHSYWARGGDVARWLVSKGLSREDRRAVMRELARRLESAGHDSRMVGLTEE